MDLEIYRKYKKSAPSMPTLDVNDFERVDASTMALRETREVSIPKSDSTERIGLTYSQRRIWFLSQVFQNPTHWNEKLALEITGTVDWECMKSAFLALGRRHDALRLLFSTDEEGTPVQSLQIEPCLSFEYIPACGDAATARANMAEHVASQMATSINLGAGPTMRVFCYQLSDDVAGVVGIAHKIICDDYSKKIIVSDFQIAYAAALNNVEPGWEDPPLRYIDYASWRRKWLDNADVGKQRDYWRLALADRPEKLELPPDYSRPAMEAFEGRAFPLEIPAAMAARIDKACERYSVDAYTYLLAAFNAFLYKYTGNTNLTVGTTILDRRWPGTSDLIGSFVEMLVMKSEVAEKESFEKLLMDVKKNCLLAYAHQDVPFDVLVEDLQPERSLAQQPIVQLEFRLHDNPYLEDVSTDEFVISSAEVFTRTDPRYDMEWHLWRTGDRYEGRVLYKTALYAEDTIRKFCDGFVRIIGQTFEQFDRPLYLMSVLSETERQRVLFGWNKTQKSVPSNTTFSQLFDDQVELWADRKAAEYGDQSLTYSELRDTCTRIARSLVDQGVKGGDVVAILHERNLDFLSAVLGIFRAGAAYLPLDPKHPPQRLARVLELSQVAHVLCSPALEQLAGETARYIRCEHKPQAHKVGSLLDAESSTTLLRHSDPYDLAYVIYTSGSTGLPKGAMIHHKGMLNHLFAKADLLRNIDLESVGQSASQCFDISVWQLLLPLLVGGKTVIMPDDVTNEPPRFLKEIDTCELAVAEVVPSVLTAMLDYCDRNPKHHIELANLKYMFVTGEALPPDLCRQWFRHYPAIPLVNAYGPTECSDDVTHYVLESPPPDNATRMPIGRPIINTSIYVLDSCLQAVPVGVAGEIYVAGDCVGMGYLNDPEQMVKSFKIDMINQRSGGWIYRTGDKGRFLPNGNIEFLGRVDFQAKLRGYRIELEEIEKTLVSHACVKQAVVTIRDDGPSDQEYLAGYLVLTEPGSATEDAIIMHMKGALPDYMVPTTLMILETLPLNKNGKVDRKRLPTPRFGSDSNYVEPSTDSELILAAIWKKVLKRDQVSANADFFALGGHSLLAAIMIEQVREKFNTYIPICASFSYPVLRALARRIEDIMAGAPSKLDIETGRSNLGVQARFEVE